MKSEAYPLNGPTDHLCLRPTHPNEGLGISRRRTQTRTTQPETSLSATRALNVARNGVVASPDTLTDQSALDPFRLDAIVCRALEHGQTAPQTVQKP
jgi:hypothetical protein